jgi:cytochrome oxidase Cu insertion factor (SCO1/SenC/PrrC family)
MGRVAPTALLALLALGQACSDSVVAGARGPRTDPEPADPVEFGELTDFGLIDQRGQAFSLADVRGRPLVVAVLFSTCSGPCPRIARSLRTLQDGLAGTDVLILAVSVDPATDTPPVLARYGQALGADPDRWRFLTGEETEIHRLVREGFYLAVERAAPGDRAVGDPVTHDTRLLAVDRAGKRRGWYAGTDEAQVERLRQRMLYLARESP